MRYNGTLQYEFTTEPSFNEYGEIVANNSNWSDFIPCLISTINMNNRGKYEDGEFFQASFEILFESNFDTDINRVRLQRGGKELGDYTILSIEALETVGRIKIIV